MSCLPPNTTSIKGEFVGANFITYWEILRDLVKEFFAECDVWQEPHWLENAITVFGILATVFYVYVLVVIICNFRKLGNTFYLCVLSLAVGDLSILISSLREGRAQEVLGSDVIRHYAWQTIGTFGMHSTVTSQLVIAVTRFTVVYTMPGGEVAARRVTIIGIVLSWLWTVTMTCFSHFGLMSYIWFEAEDAYQDEMRFPFWHIQIFTLLGIIAATFLFYCALTVVTFRIRHSSSRANFIREVYMFIQCVLIFVCELCYLCAANWLGYKYLHIGSVAFNQTFFYVVRPLAVGVTPFIYVAFSTKLRQSLWQPFVWCKPARWRGNADPMKMADKRRHSPIPFEPRNVTSDATTGSSEEETMSTASADIPIWYGDTPNPTLPSIKAYIKISVVLNAIFIVIIPNITLIFLNWALITAIKNRGILMVKACSPIAKVSFTNLSGFNGTVKQEEQCTAVVTTGNMAPPRVRVLTNDSLHAMKKLVLQMSTNENLHKYEHKLAITVCAIVSCFTVTQGPAAIIHIINSLTSSTSRSWHTAQSIASFLTVFGISLNFFLFCFISSHFRKRLKAIVLAKFKPHEGRMDYCTTRSRLSTI